MRRRKRGSYSAYVKLVYAMTDTELMALVREDWTKTHAPPVPDLTTWRHDALVDYVIGNDIGWIGGT